MSQFSPDTSDTSMSLLGRIADDFTERQRRGERPSIDEYAEEHPTLADLIRKVLPLLVALTDTSTDRTPTSLRNQPSAALPHIPGYEVLSELGRGGMGVVYKARQLTLNRVVALKMVRDAGDDNDLRRFLAEGEAIARLRHPNIVQVYELGTHEGRPFFSLEYCVGGSLAERLRDEVRPPRAAAALVEALARAVHAAHQAGIVHRDLKPANVLLTDDGTPKVTDFGLAKRAEPGRELTQTGAIVGTPSYMAPEQTVGDPRAVGPAADVWALGIILYECLTGRLPFKGATLLETLELVRSQEPVPVRQLQPKVPRDLDTICLKCLHKVSSRRYDSADALADDLRRYLEGRPITARPVAVVERAWRWSARNPALALVGVALLLSLIVGSVVSTVFGLLAYDEAERARDLAGKEAAAREQVQREQRLTLAEKSQKERELERAETLLYGRQITQAFREWRDGNLGAAWDALDETRWDLRGWEFDLLNGLFRSHQVVLEGHSDAPRAAAFSPDGRRVASAGKDRTLRIWDAGTGRPLHRIDVNVDASIVAMSPDGGLVVCGSEGGSLAWGDAGGRRLRLTTTGLGKLLALAFSPDGSLLAASFSGKPNTLALIDGKTFQVLRSSATPFPATGLAFTPDGARVWLSGGEGGLAARDPGTGQEAEPPGRPLPGVRDVVLARDGRAVQVRGGRVRVWDTASEKVPIPFDLSTEGDDFTHLALSGDGRRLLMGQGPSGVPRVLKVIDRVTRRLLFSQTCVSTESLGGLAIDHDGSRLVYGRVAMQPYKTDVLHVCSAPPDPVTRLFPDAVGPPAFSPDGTRLAATSRDGNLGVWNLRTGERLTAGPRVRGKVVWDPTGRRLAAVADKLIKVCDPDTGRELRTLQGHADIVLDLAFSPDGTRLVSGSKGNKPHGVERGQLKLWDVESGKVVHNLSETDQWVGRVDFSPDGRFIAASDFGGEVRVYDAADGRLVRSLPETRGLSRVQFYPDGRRLLCTDPDNRELRVWNLDSGMLVLTMTGHQALAAALSPAGRRVATVGPDQTLRLWDADKGEQVLALRIDQDVKLAVAFSPDGRRIAASGPGPVHVWEAPTRPRNHLFPAASRQPSALAFGPGDELAMSGHRTGWVKMWNLTTGREVTSFQAGPAMVTHLAPRPDGRRLAVVLADHKVRFWDATSGQEEPPSLLNASPVRSVAFSRDGRRLAVCRDEGRVEVWEEQAAQPERILLGHTRYVGGLSFSPDGRVLLTTGGEGEKEWGVRMWDLSDGTVRWSSPRQPGSRVPVTAVFSPGGVRLAVPGLGDGTGVWDVATGQLLKVVPEPESDWAGWLDDGRLVVGSEEGCRVWEVETGRLVQHLTGLHQPSVFALSSDRRRLLSGSPYQPVRLTRLEP